MINLMAIHSLRGNYRSPGMPDAGSARLLCVAAHPIDAVLAFGGLLASAAAAGVETYLLVATRGDLAWSGKDGAYPGPERAAATSGQELRAAARALGVHQLTHLSHRDGELSRLDAAGAAAAIFNEIARIKPDAVVTYEADSPYSLSDQSAIARYTEAAVARCAATADGRRPAPGLYQLIWDSAAIARFEAAYDALPSPSAGPEREPAPAVAGATTQAVDASSSWELLLSALACQRSQFPGYEALARMPAWWQLWFWSQSSFELVGQAVPDRIFVRLRSGAAAGVAV
jgi:LmbE family N-acetylglucosaminyl deacetylase